MHSGTCIAVFLRNILHLSSNLYPIIIGTHPHNPENHNTKATSHMRWLNWKTNQCFNSSTVSILVIPGDNRYSFQNPGLFTVQLPDTAGSPREFKCIQIALNLYGYVKFLSYLYTICQHHTMKYKH
jgi:hypothetical protein